MRCPSCKVDSFPYWKVWFWGIFLGWPSRLRCPSCQALAKVKKNRIRTFFAVSPLIVALVVWFATAGDRNILLLGIALFALLGLTVHRGHIELIPKK